MVTDEDPDETSSSKRPATFLNAVALGNMRLFKRHVSEDIGADLNQGYDTFTEKKDLGSEGFGDLLGSIRAKNISLENIHFVTFRNNLNKILGAAYNRHELLEMGVHKKNVTINGL